jgi:hypothetical protein
MCTTAASPLDAAEAPDPKPMSEKVSLRFAARKLWARELPVRAKAADFNTALEVAFIFMGERFTSAL